MVSIKEIKAEDFIEKASSELKRFPELKAPAWASFVKTGAHRERKPERPDWWYLRCASILRRLYIEGNVGVGRLRTWYGGRKNRGSKPEKHVDASAHIIRSSLQQLENAGLVKKEKFGRSLSPKGRSFVDKIVLSLRPKIERKEEVKRDESRGRSTKRTTKKTTTGAGKKATRTTKASTTKKPSRTKSKGKADKDKNSKPRTRSKS